VNDILVEKNNSHENILSKIKYLNQVYIGKKNGLFILNEIEDELIEIFPRDRNYSWKLSNVNVLHVDFKDRLWFGSDEGVGYYYKGQWKLFTGKEGLPFKYFTCIAGAPDGEIWFGTKKGAIRTDGKNFHYRFSRRWLPDDYVNDILVEKNNSHENILSKIKYLNQVYIGKKNGLFILNEIEDELIEIFPRDRNYSWKLSNVNVLHVDFKDRLWFGSDEGVGYYYKGQWKLFTGKEGLPFKYFTCIAGAPDGEIWFGTKKGAIRTDGKNFHYRFSRRWLPDDYVNDILVEKDGTVWLATNNGVSRIIFQSMTLEEKANLFTEQVESYHNRMGFIAQNRLKIRYDKNSWEPAISDNDGTYTAMYGAAQAFRYAVTGNLEAKKLAKRSFNACKWLVDITHEKGFPARVIIPIDWPEPVNKQYDQEYNIRKQKEDPFWKNIIPRFVKSKDGKYLWKCDTSSDELSGHYFFYGIYYDLVADTEEEKKLVREVVRDITDHLIRHGLVFHRDHAVKIRGGSNDLLYREPLLLPIFFPLQYRQPNHNKYHRKNNARIIHLNLYHTSKGISHLCF
jgi:hypothetical protein